MIKSKEEQAARRKAEAHARRIELRAQEHTIARGMLDRLRATPRLDERDRPILARNLGEMIELAGRGGARSPIMHRTFEIAFGMEAAESALKKRARYARFKDEALPRDNPGPDRYAAAGRTFARLAEAFADAVHGPGNEDMRLHAALRLLARSSLDQRAAQGVRVAGEERETLARAFDKIRDAVLREVDLLSYFKAVARWPLLGHYDLAEAAASAHERGDLWLFKDELKAAGIDPASTDPDALRDRLAGKLTPDRWDWCCMEGLLPRGMTIRPDLDMLDPTEFIPGGPIQKLHRNLPRLPVGHVYLPGIVRFLRIPKPFDPDTIDADDLYNTVIDSMRAFDVRSIDLQAHERVIFRREVLYIIIAPNKAIDDLYIGLHFCDHITKFDLFGYNYLTLHPISLTSNSRLGYSVDDTSTTLFDVLHERTYETETNYIKIRELDMLLTDQDVLGQEIMMRSRLCNRHDETTQICDDGFGIKTEDLRAGYVPPLIVHFFNDPEDVWTPLPQTSLGGAIVRNLTAAPPEQRLDHLLAQQARGLAEPVERFLAERRATVDRAWGR